MQCGVYVCYMLAVYVCVVCVWCNRVVCARSVCARCMRAVYARSVIVRGVCAGMLAYGTLPVLVGFRATLSGVLIMRKLTVFLTPSAVARFIGLIIVLATLPFTR